MPIIFITLAAMLFGGYKRYSAVSGTWGAMAGVLAVLVAVLAMVAGIVGYVHRHRSLHGRAVNGERLLQAS